MIPKQHGDEGPVRIGLIAGNGGLPIMIAQRLHGDGRHEVVAVAHRGETRPELDQWVVDMEWIRLGQFKKAFSFLRKQGVSWVVLAGGIEKASIWRMRPDALALKVALSLRHLNDDHLLRGVAAVIEREGFVLKGAAELLPDLLAPAGILSRRQPDPDQWADIRFGWQAAKSLGSLDIGQGVVVRRKAVVAVEAMEGTDAMLARAGPLAGGAGVFVKVAKPQQDRRLDLPTVGPATVARLVASNIQIMAIEAGAVQILEPQEMLRLADRNGLIVVACDGREMDAPSSPPPNG